MSTDDTKAWAGRLYDVKAAQLVLYGRALGLSHAEAEDVLHETFRALLALDEAPQQPEHYVVRSFRNRALNYRRGWWRRLARELEAARWFEPTDPADPAEQRLAAALAELPQEQREVIVLKIWHRLTFVQIARLLDCSPNTAAGRFRYGVVRLRRVLAAARREHAAEEPERGWSPETPEPIRLRPARSVLHDERSLPGPTGDSALLGIYPRPSVVSIPGPGAGPSLP